MEERRNTRSRTSKAITTRKDANKTKDNLVNKKSCLSTVNKDVHKRKRQSDHLDVLSESALPFKEKRKENMPAYKKSCRRNINEDTAHKQKRRSTRQSNHIYDLDISNEPVLPYKKTREGFKLKKTIEKRKLEIQQNKKLKKKQKHKSKGIVPNKAGKTQVENAIAPGDVDKSISPSGLIEDNQQCNEIMQELLEEDNNFDDLVDDNVEQINDASLVGQGLNIMPENSTPVISQLDNNNKSIDFKRSLYKNFISPIVKPCTIASTNTSQGSPWRLNAVENNRFPANFPLKSSHLPSYDKDVSLRLSVSESFSPRISLTQPNNPIPPTLFEDVVAVSIKDSSEQNINTNTLETSNNSDHSPHANNETKQESCTLDDNDNTTENRNSVFGFHSITQTPLRVLRTRNENVAKPTRVSLREIKNVISNSKKPKSLSDKENSKKQTPNLISCTITATIEDTNEISEVVSENIMKDTSESEIQSSSRDEILLFEDPDEPHPTLNRDESFQCYQPKGKKRRKQIFERQYEKEIKQKKISTKNKLTVEEWVAARKWEQNFNAMLEEVESFEMVIEPTN